MSGFASAGGFAMPCAPRAGLEPGVSRLAVATLGPQVLAAFGGRMVRIWSEDRRAWWRPNGAGYTIDQGQAGEFLFEDAYRRVRGVDLADRPFFDILP